jgi:RNA polymerase sigma-70 factor (ECF subfamily)
MDADLLEELYRKYHRSAMLYCTALCGDPQLAQDIASEAFVKAYLSLPNNIPSFRYWLLRVCKNLWLDFCRRQSRLAGADALEHIPDHRTPEVIHLENEQKQALWRCLDALPPKDREIIILHYFSGLPLKEIAPLMGLGYDTVRQRIARLRNKLRQELEEQGYGR